MVQTSFRDPAGFVCCEEDRVLRHVHANETDHTHHLLMSDAIQELIEKRCMPSAKIDSTSVYSPEFPLVIEHSRVTFPSYPYEWCPEMLREAGLLTLTICERALQEGLCLKDGSPYNVLFEGTKPIFVDLLSFERRDPLDPIWLPYAQFMRMFVLPLIQNREFNTPLSQLFLTHRDGIEPEQIKPLIKGVSRFKPSLLSAVLIPCFLTQLMNRSKHEGKVYRPHASQSPEKAEFILRNTLKGLRRKLKRYGPKERGSKWSGYLSLDQSYTPEQFAEKERIVTGMLTEIQPKKLLDIGCNKGHFSAIAARLGARVVGIDTDPAVVGTTWRLAKHEGLDILPLHVDIGRPTPATGWRYLENSSFLKRAEGHFDTVQALAVIHHLLIQERIPLSMLAKLFYDITTSNLIIEYVSPEDAMFKRITRGREALYAHLTRELFEKEFSSWFIITSTAQITGSNRTLYLMKKNPSGALTNQEFPHE